MKDLYDITEGILDDADDIMDKADAIAHVKICADWLRTHGARTGKHLVPLDYVVKEFTKDPYYYDADTETWHLKGVVLTVGKNDPVPSFFKVDILGGVNLQGWDQAELPSFVAAATQTVSIRNCPKLKSLRGCPQKVNKFAVSNCPNIKSLDGCPKEVIELFKAIDCGVKFEPKDIKRHCNVDKRNMVY